MTKFIIQPHGRLNDWVAEEKGYFAAEGLDYELNVEGSRKNTPRLPTVDRQPRSTIIALARSNGTRKGTDAKEKARAM